MNSEASSGVPTLVVHGLWDSKRRIEPLVRGLDTRGIRPIHSFDLLPNDGRASIGELADQIASQVEQLRSTHGGSHIDLVGFSMGALAARYYLQRRGGTECVRRFISISGPHAGTYTAYGFWPRIPIRGAACKCTASTRRST